MEPTGHANGYEAARQLHAGRLAEGWRPLGRKIGFTNRSIWPRYGVYEPIWGTVYDRTLIHAQRNRATVPLAAFAHPRIEPEICFGLKATPPRSRDPAALLGAIEWIAHAVEIVQCRNSDWKVTLDEATSWNGLHGCLVVGTPIPVSTLPGLAQSLPLVEVALSCNGTVKDKGVGANVLDSPLLALAFLVATVELAAGEIVSTGTLTDAHLIHPGETWSTSFSGLPLQGLEIAFT